MARRGVEVELLEQRSLEPDAAPGWPGPAERSIRLERSVDPGARPDVVVRLERLWGWLRRRALERRVTPNPRVNSVVRRFVWEDADDVLHRYEEHVITQRMATAGRLHMRERRLELDDDHHDYRVPARLRVRWSFWSYPVWLSIEPWWGDRTVVGMELRSRHRVHYSRRYYDAAHDALRALVVGIGSPIGPRTAQPPPRPPRPRRPSTVAVVA